jgi:hypothetical protein
MIYSKEVISLQNDERWAGLPSRYREPAMTFLLMLSRGSFILLRSAYVNSFAIAPAFPALSNCCYNTCVCMALCVCACMEEINE